ncbi:glycoside hydrolase family 32 protein [Cellulomonas sp. RIT-PI-Y]|uniref:glycoside hydrolase family 32 protein n=1 Tax=Cellulomonas sp. RIT-PI-Y TaxID=3035297 RepID=UPI0021D94898|nr:glycoside hydrolase family 32 protein [Cellulomonas sp. RIT-PI-Y]
MTAIDRIDTPRPPAPAGMTRPRFHLTPRRNWMNDPNGLVHHGGLWHVYYQYNPESPDWGNMSWGHATSPDLLRWTEHPVALRYRDGEQVFSGSVVASRTPEDGTLTALYTSAYDDQHQAQSRATSTDGGWTWDRDPANPVLDRGTAAFRDPKVTRYVDNEGRARWILVAVEADDRQVLFYESSDLREWEHLSTFGPIGPKGVVWECPDLLRLPVDGGDEERWVLLLSTNPVGEHPDPDGSSMSYVVGDFDGREFTADEARLVRLDHGRDLYAGVTFDRTPSGEAVLLAWMNNWRYAHEIPTSPWRGAMSLPRRLDLTRSEGRYLLRQAPVGEVAEWLRAAVPSTVPGVAQPFEHRSGGHLLCELGWDPRSTGPLTVRLNAGAGAEVAVRHEVATGELRVTRTGPAAESVHPDFPTVSTAALSSDRPARLLVSLDGSLLEVFVNGGEQCISNLVPFGPGPVTVSVDTSGRGPVTITTVDPVVHLPATPPD